MARIPSYLLNLAGEYRVCSELNKRGIFATVTYGNRKGVDVYAISDENDRTLRIEVKTTQRKKFVTSITKKRLADAAIHPDFWVLCQVLSRKNSTFEEKFFVLSHEEICQVQAERNNQYAKKYSAKHGKQPDFSTGVDNVHLVDVAEHENQWSKIIDKLGGPVTVHPDSRQVRGT